jgi:pyruvate/2-oxoglutarate dehydrogenase complex dihydrolipoamide dehydrogenase (E3) component
VHGGGGVELRRSAGLSGDQGRYNVVVIGGGTAGLVTAAGTAGLGGRVALVEKHRMGGDCLNTGCVPSKALIASARAAHTVRHASRWGLHPAATTADGWLHPAATTGDVWLRDGEPVFAFEAVMDRVRERRAAIAPNDSQERFESLGVDVFRGPARFVSPHEVAVGDLRLRAAAFVIATGSRAALPPVEGLAEARPYTNETLFDELRARPDGMIILGGGPIGCELGQAFARLGVRVTVVQSAPRLLEKEDPDVADVVRKAMEADGVTVRTAAMARRVRRDGARVRVEVSSPAGDEVLEAEALLVAAGRLPNVEGLGLETAGVAFTGKGVTVDARLRTSQPHIYAAGDVAGGPQFTHLADHHARIVVRNILTPVLKAKADTTVLPWCTFTSPEVGRVGLSEMEAQKAGVAHDVWVQPLADVDRAVVEGETRGFAKVITEKGSDRILGAAIVAERGGDLVHEIVVAMRAGVGLKDLSSTIHAYPTYAEIARRAADRYQRSRLTPRTKALFEWLYRRARRG